MATRDTPLPLDSMPLRDSRGGIYVVAHHILLANYLNHRGLRLSDPEPPNAQHTRPSAGGVGRDSAQGGGGVPQPVQQHFGPAEANNLTPQRASLPGTALPLPRR